MKTLKMILATILILVGSAIAFVAIQARPAADIQAGLGHPDLLIQVVVGALVALAMLGAGWIVLKTA